MKIRNNPLLKGLAFLLACCMVAGITVLGLVIALNGTAVMYGDDWGSLYDVQRMLRQDQSKILNYLVIQSNISSGRPVSDWERGAYQEYEAYLDPANTNLRWEVTDQNGKVLQGNVPEEESGQSYTGQLRYDAPSTMADGEPAVLRVWVNDWMQVQDAYSRAIQIGILLHSYLNVILVGIVAMAVVLVVCLIFLMAGAGYQSKTGALVLNWFHRIPGDILFALIGLATIFCVGLAVDLLEDVVYHYQGAFWTFGRVLAASALASGLLAILLVAGLDTFAARCRSHTLWRNTIVWRCCHFAWSCVLWLVSYARRTWKELWQNILVLPLVWRTAVAYGGYALFTLFVIGLWRWYDLLLPLWIVATGLLALRQIRWAAQWARLRRGVQEIIGGNRQYVIQSAGMYPDLKEHADVLNNLNQVITQAVEDQTNSERFKAELITNVSHDLKTPLTSIINYVDLMKKEPIENPRVQEYLEVLDRKSQRLKKLTEDLVEASKASTGNLSVSLERLDLVLLTDQALGEWVERLEASNLTLVRTLPDSPVWVYADGRHLWRVLDNLLSNCSKYAMAGTRVYVSLECGSQAVLTVKNISRDPLDVPAERLMERFVRGDASRTESGSGLGLSIAQSLTELQGGTFRLDIDGDLFKAIVSLPIDAEPGTVLQL